MLDRYRLRITPRASNDIAAICGHIEGSSPQNAVSVAGDLIDAIDSLDLFPHRYKVHEHRRNPSMTVRSMPVPPFIVYYRVRDAELVVEIICVRHGARRQPRRFR